MPVALILASFEFVGLVWEAHIRTRPDVERVGYNPHPILDDFTGIRVDDILEGRTGLTFQAGGGIRLRKVPAATKGNT